MLTAESLHPARWWHALPDGRVQCDLCPRDCQLHEGQRGACFVRQMVNGAMQLTTYGRSSGFCIDPVGYRTGRKRLRRGCSGLHL